MSFHQPTNSFADVYNAYLYKDVYWSAHFHRGFEIVCVLKGSINTTIDGKAYRLREGECAWISPYQIHSYDHAENSLTCIIVFSERYVAAYAQKHRNQRSTRPTFQLSPTVQTLLYNTLLADIPETSAYTLKLPQSDEYLLKSFLYAVCSDFEKNTDYTPSSYDDSIVFKIIDFIEANYLSGISLHTLADALGYSYDYISRVFSQRFHLHFTTLVNQYRCEYATNLLTNKELSITEIALQSGFQSIRSFNRIFRLITGKSPSKFRNTTETTH
jgi:YesN/AraC family two-component response regulator